MFKPVDPKKSLPEVEKEQLEYWATKQIFEQSVEARKKNEKFIFFDGPPFANGLPHYGHILASALKDAVTRYWTMKGYYVPRANGWDCHGLPVEYEIEKALEVSGHKQIEELGVDVFNQKCRESVFKYTGQWESMLKRVGRWLDFENGYATLDYTYMESIWHVFNQVWNKDLVYKGHRSMHICPRCETPLSNFEVTQGYKDVTDFTVIAKFKLKDEHNTFLLAWTTTPWTLPGNQALAVGSEIEYIMIEHQEQHLILAKELLATVMADKEFNIVTEMKGSDLIGKAYEPLFPYYTNTNGPFEVLDAEFVTTEDGTGIVHIAGGYGQDDYNLIKDFGAEPISHVGIDGIFQEEVTEFAGKFVKGQDQNIAKYIEEKNLLFKGDNYRHSYPHCWRCNTPLLNYTLDAWFIEVTKVKDDLIKNNKKIKWQPEHIQEGRFGKWLENVKDWNVSRNRFWGCPIPIWETESGKTRCISSMRELRAMSKDGNNLFFVRHGEAEHNVLGVMSSDLHTHRELTEKGQQQAQTVREKLKDKKISAIYCSPFHRTKQTTEIINKEFGVEVIFDDRLREKMSGELEGKSFDERTKELRASKDPYNHNVGNSGESYQNLEERMLDFLNELSGKHQNENILIVTHGGVLSTVKRYFEDNEKNMEALEQSPYIPHDDVMEFYAGKMPLNNGKLDLHKPYIDEITLIDPETGEDMTRIKEVFDCWFESGSMPYAQLHYPFENKEYFEKNFPADFIAEGLDQTRGWFYTLHVLSTILFDKPAFKNVIVNGILLAANGEKLSKSKKNYPDPSELFESKGVDSTRLFLYQSTAALAEDVRFSSDHVDEIVKKFSLTLWNTYSFFVTYGNIDGFIPQNNWKAKPKHELDRWIISELHQLITEVTNNMDEYNLSKATRPLMDFVDNLSNWYIRRSRRRFWKSENDTNKTEAYQTLHYVLSTFTQIIAPFTPFIADEIYRNLQNDSSVHLTNWPLCNPKLIDLDLNEKMHTIRNIVSLGHAIRGKDNIKVRQPLSKIQVALPDNKQIKYVEELKDVVLEELNIKELEIFSDPAKFVTQTLKPNAKVLGSKLGGKMKEVINAAREANFEIKGDKVHIAGEELPLEDFEVRFEAKDGYSAESNLGVVVILDTTITDELKKEGWVRDIVRQIQDLRKDTEYDVSDRIYLYLKTEDKDLENAITLFAEYIKTETLSLELQQGNEFEWEAEKEVEINDVKLTIGIRR
jgi:isoleucyl-tRNA synthetase